MVHLVQVVQFSMIRLFQLITCQQISQLTSQYIYIRVLSAIQCVEYLISH